jgi:peptidoglycan/LPS O-acetylase OafA/YrhL
MKRIASLDSLRGIAALIVVANHCALIFPSRLAQRRAPWLGGSWGDRWSWVDFTPLKLLFSGDQAVLVFFALSGFVLALTFKVADKWDFRSYLLKRLFRIYPPFVFAIGVSASLFWLANPHLIPQLSGWFNYASWDRPLTIGILGGHLAMLDLPKFHELDHVMWSLVQEMRISLIFPLIIWGVKYRWKLTMLSAIATSAFALVIHHYLKAPLIVDPFATLQYVYLFAAGAILALNAEKARAFFAKLPGYVRAALWFATLCLVTYPANRQLGLFVCGSASVMLVCLCFAERRVDEWLSAKPFVWLGKISYSLYLLHVPILLFIVHVLYGKAPLLALLACTVAISLISAELAYRFVEVPAIKLGRRLANSTSSKTVTSLQAA